MKLERLCKVAQSRTLATTVYPPPTVRNAPSPLYGTGFCDVRTLTFQGGKGVHAKRRSLRGRRELAYNAMMLGMSTVCVVGKTGLRMPSHGEKAGVHL